MKLRGTILLLLLLVGGALLYWGWLDRREHSQDTHIMQAAMRYGVAPGLIKAVVWRESRFEPDTHGRAGELGLMQIRKVAATEWAKAEHVSNFDHESLLDPATNTLAGTWYLRKLLVRYAQTDNPLPYALADYNAGRSNVLRWNKGEASTNSAAFLTQMDFPGTRKYIATISDRVHRYQQEFIDSQNNR